MKDNFEQFLRVQHSTLYAGFDDARIRDFEEWLSRLGIEDWLEWGDSYARWYNETIK